MEKFDLIIVGTGSGNMVPGPDHEGWKIAIVEADRFGGTCLNRGCIPSKMLIHAADVAETVQTAAKFGVNARIESIDWDRVVGRVWGRIDPMAQAGERWRGQQPNQTVFKGEARFVGERMLEVDGRQIRAPKIVLAPGSRPWIPSIPGLGDVSFHTSDTVMRLPEQPKRLTILGGGYIGAELGHFFGSLGTEVTIVQRGGALLKAEDEEISQRFTELYSRRFNVLLNTEVSRARSDRDGITVDLSVNGRQQSVSSDVLLVATGRVPNSDTLDVAASGIEVDERGRVKTNDQLETNVPGIWALGDITNPFQLKHMANLEVRVCAHNVVHLGHQRAANYYAAPHAVFASPQVAGVGLTEQAARQSGVPYVVGRKDYSRTAYGWALEDTDSFVKVLANPETRQVLGGHIIGPDAAILLQSLVNAMRLGETVDQLARETIYVHPALTEVVEQALLEI